MGTAKAKKILSKKITSGRRRRRDAGTDLGARVRASSYQIWGQGQEIKEMAGTGRFWFVAKLPRLTVCAGNGFGFWVSDLKYFGLKFHGEPAWPGPFAGQTSNQPRPKPRHPILEILPNNYMPRRNVN